MNTLPENLIIKLNRTLIAEVSFTYDVTSVDRANIDKKWKELTKGQTQKQIDELSEKCKISHRIKVDVISFYRKPDKNEEKITEITWSEFDTLHKRISEIISLNVEETYSDYFS